ncbi:MAG: ABC transporter ATP-binding protein [Patescibacteria group bacterium]|mgnify:CR=1 FL=1
MKKIISSFSDVFSTTKWVASLYVRTNPVLASTYLIASSVISLGNLINAYIIARVTDEAIKIYMSGSVNVDSMVPILAMILGSSLFFGFTRIISRHAWRMLYFQDWMNLRKILYQRLLELGVSKLEKPEIANKTQRFSEEINNVTGYLEMSVGLVGNLVGFVGALVVLLRTIPAIIPFYSVVLIIELVADQKFIRKLWVLSRDTTEERRKFISTSSVLGESSYLKELMLSDGVGYLVKKFDEYKNWIVQETTNIRKQWNYWKIFGELLDASAFGFGLFLILKRLAARMISVGQLTFEIRSLRLFADSFSGVTGNFVSIRESAIKLSDIRELFTDYEPDIDGKKSIRAKVPEIKLKNLSFSYPDNEKMVLSNLNLIIKPGEKVAIVGENGAGKTTLVKLLSRFYRCTQGEILIDKLNINDLKIANWYSKLGVLFQDYNTYSHLTLKENIEIGRGTYSGSMEEIKQSLGRAGALDFVLDYPAQFDQVLSEKYKNGIRPSTGQWQKIAIARFFYRDAPVLILDEPTASIDAVAEAQIFDNIYKFIKNKTVIIISHRFSTVRNADRIIVLDKGKIVEQGTHEELLENNGKYANAFNLQAKGYV